MHKVSRPSAKAWSTKGGHVAVLSILCCLGGLITFLHLRPSSSSVGDYSGPYRPSPNQSRKTEPAEETAKYLISIESAILVQADSSDAAVEFVHTFLRRSRHTSVESNPSTVPFLLFSDERTYAACVAHRPRFAATIVAVLLADCGPAHALAVRRMQRVGGTTDEAQRFDFDSPCQHRGGKESESNLPPAIPQGISRWLSRGTGAFLLEAVQALVSLEVPPRSGGRRQADVPLFKSNASIVAVDPTEAWLCPSQSDVGLHLMELFTPHGDHRFISLVPILKALGHFRANQTMTHSADHVAWWRSTQRGNGRGSDTSQQSDPMLKVAENKVPMIVSPYVFGGTRDVLRAFASEVRELLEMWPVPPGFPMEMVLAALLQRRDHAFRVRLVSAEDAPMVTPTQCGAIRRCMISPPQLDELGKRSRRRDPLLPVVVLNTKHCMWTKPMLPPPLIRPICQSKWFDDFYLLHSANSVTRAIPRNLLVPHRLGDTWSRRRQDDMSVRRGDAKHSRSAASVESIDVWEPHLSSCVGGGRSAVLGMCGSYPPHIVAPFVTSFAKFHTRSCSQLYLFVEEAQRASYMAAFGAEPDIVIVVIDPLRAQLRLRDCAIVHWRKEYFYRWLEQKEDELREALQRQEGVSDEGAQPRWLRYVMVVDTRDAHFQADPFDPLKEIVPQVAEGLLQRQVDPHHNKTADTGIVYLLPERFETPGVDMLDSGVHAVQRDRIIASCGKDAYNWGLGVPLTPLWTGSLGAMDEFGSTPLQEAFPLINSGLYFGDYEAMKGVLRLLTESMAACSGRMDDSPSTSSIISSACGTSNDQGMLHCLAMGGFDNAGFGHHVVLLNPDTHRYTHMFRYESYIQFSAQPPRSSSMFTSDAVRNDSAGHLRTGLPDPFGNAFVYPCAESERSRLRSSLSTPSTSPWSAAAARPYAIVHQSEYAPEYQFYVAESVCKL